MTQHADQLQRFLFEHGNVRGEYVQLHSTLANALAGHDYGPEQTRLVGESLAAVALLSATLKFRGKLSLQAQGNGPVSLLVAECTHERHLRGLLRASDPETRGSFPQLLGGGKLVINIDPEGGQRYQGIVPLEADTLAGCLEDYFTRSEQLDSCLLLTASGEQARGLMLQRLPGEAPDTDFWHRVQLQARTLRQSELAELECITLLQRLFPSDSLRLLEPEPVGFSCTCTRERTAAALEALGRDDCYTLLAQQGEIRIDCQFCQRQYCYRQEDLDRLFGRPALH